jgi:hypothetical protein
MFIDEKNSIFRKEKEEQWEILLFFELDFVSEQRIH